MCRTNFTLRNNTLRKTSSNHQTVSRPTLNNNSIKFTTEMLTRKPHVPDSS